MNRTIRTRCAVALLALCGVMQARGALLEVTGRIVPAPCTLVLSPVDMGKVPLADFLGSPGSGVNYGKNFQVGLAGCDLQTLHSASLDFTGATVPGSNDTLLALTPDPRVAAGIGIQIVRTDATHPGDGLSVVFNRNEGIPFDVGSIKTSYDFKAFYSPVQGAAPRAGTANATATVTLTYS
ncbi:Fimbrial protein [compost metagenome]|jgi:type 1 fimbria pilin|uniref:fimbrial protein n=1 Tax=Achromobacter sp. Root83 TaxID=1736602 RepID=UPI000ABB7078|nr:fimbrial protein [Achromobacter sp. Root83]